MDNPTTVRAEVANLKRFGMKNGMKTLHQDSILKVKQGMTTIEEALANYVDHLVRIDHHHRYSQSTNIVPYAPLDKNFSLLLFYPQSSNF